MKWTWGLAGCCGGLVLAWGLSVAEAEELKPTAMQCRVFSFDLRKLEPVIDTSDRTSTIGQWVGEREAEGYRLADLDFEVGTKGTGFSQGYVQACVTKP